MSATKTQIYFTQEQRERIDRAAASKGVTMAALVRKAVDEYLGEEVDPRKALTSTFGAAPDAFVPSRDESHVP